jgi:Pyruvate/2-oxoacid:ferredoxin oxidoreductase delta subunit
MFAVKSSPFADESAPTNPMICTHYCGSEFIREEAGTLNEFFIV